MICLYSLVNALLYSSLIFLVPLVQLVALYSRIYKQIVVTVATCCQKWGGWCNTGEASEALV